MARLLLAALIVMAPTLVSAATCTTASSECNPGPCLASAAASWDCGHVPNSGSDTAVISANHYLILDADLNLASGSSIIGTLVSDGNRRAITVHSNDSISDQDISLLGTGVFNLKGGDRMICDGDGANDECAFLTFLPASAASFYLDGTIGNLQSAGSVSRNGTEWTIGDIDTSGFEVGDVLVWHEGGNAEGYWYEIITLDGSSITYDTALADSLSDGLMLTPDEGTLGGGPTVTHSLPDIDPVAGDNFKLIAPIKFMYDTSDGGYWQITRKTAAMNVGTNIRMNGFSIVNSSGEGGANGHIHMVFDEVTGHTGERSFSYWNLGEHLAQAPYFIHGQDLSFDYVYCHDSLAGSTSTGACLCFQKCLAQNCPGGAYSPARIFIGHFHGTHTTSHPLQVGFNGDVTNSEDIVIWRPLLHDGGNSSGIESNGMQCSDCDNSLIYGGRCWNIHDPDGSGGNCYDMAGDGIGSRIIDSWAVNTGNAFRLETWTGINLYGSNVRGHIVTCMGARTTVPGTVAGLLGAAWSIDANGRAGIANCNVDGAILLGNSTQPIVPAWELKTDTPTTALTVRNVVADGYRGDYGAFHLASQADVHVSFEHITCGGLGGGSPYCIRNDTTNADGTTTVRDVASRACNNSPWYRHSSSAAENLDTTVRQSGLSAVEACATAFAGNEDWLSGEIDGGNDLGFVDIASNDYNLQPTSILQGAGKSPPGSSVGVRCSSIRPDRFVGGLTIDHAYMDIMTEPCSDADGDHIEGASDNCVTVPNGPAAGTCVTGQVGAGCLWSNACVTVSAAGLCSYQQEDLDGDGAGDACDADQDGDGYDAALGDCDDRSPVVYPGAPEICDGLDNDCDGVADNGPPPAEVPAVAFSADDTLSWIPAAGAAVYDVVTGNLDGLATDGMSAATLGCVAEDAPPASVIIQTTPPPGGGFWYMVRGANCLASGSYGIEDPPRPISRDAAIALSNHDCTP